MSTIDVVLAEPGSGLVAALLERYYAELDTRFPGGFDAAQSIPGPDLEFSAPHGAFLVARVDDRSVGCGGIRRLDEATGEIKRMWIDPNVRGRGLGRGLLAALEQVARELHYEVVRLDTSAHLAEALALYLSAGYGQITAYNDNPYASHWLEKSLSAPAPPTEQRHGHPVSRAPSPHADPAA